MIKQPGEGFCYLKQSYDSDPSKMELMVRAAKEPLITLPFWQGIVGDVTYQVDDGPIGIIPEDDASELGINLPKDIVPDLQAGIALKVRVRPVYEPTVEQHFSLIGFTAGYRLLDGADCK